ncbi:hypothetical protein [Flagellimonas iocasae]|uniref:Uncharacterized protein n=1 Tax=Flagellimonas iocasae TaxID=2055905 RepID=A0ABW4Y131_9FLAO
MAQKAALIKLHVPSGHYKDALRINPLIGRYILQNPFFESIESIYIKDPFSFLNDLKSEFRWITWIIDNFLQEINDFLKLKCQFDKSILLENFTNAKELLVQIETKFGISLWSIEASLLIKDHEIGSEANWNALSDYLRKIKNPIYEFIINSSSKRIESKVSFQNFITQFQNDIDAVNTEGALRDFLVFKNFSYPDYEYSHPNLEGVLYVTNTLSIIDQYLIVIDVIEHNIWNSPANDSLFIPFLRNANQVVKNDPKLRNLYNAINTRNELVIGNGLEIYLDCMNSYYRGDFEKALELSKKGIKENPIEYEFFEVYCKSLINLGYDFQALPTSQSINEILHQTYDLLSFNSVEDKCFIFLTKVSLIYMNTTFGKQIFALLSEIEGRVDSRNYIRGFLSSNYSSFRNMYMSNSRNLVFNNYSDLLNSHCFKVYLFKNGHDIDFENDVSMSPKQRLSYEALRNYGKSDFRQVINLLKSNIELDDIPYYLERKYSLLYNSYIKIGEYREALILFGVLLFDKTFVGRKFDNHLLFESIENSNSKESLISLIEYPILCSLNLKEYDLFEIYDDFLFQQGINHLNEIQISALIEKFSKQETIFFLENVATIDTIKYSSDYQSISQVEEDRIMILENLRNINPKDTLKYEKEINEILRINSVRKVLREVDEGRLYIDVNSLKKKLVKKFEDQFKRFKEIEQSASSSTLVGFNPSKTKNWEAVLKSSGKEYDSLDSAEYLAFKNIYIESRENFLFSKEYGLDSSLSTRIRHGALKNHIRSVFEKLDLVTSKSQNQYKENEVWKVQLGNNFLLNHRVQEILQNLSKEVDDYIEFIIDKLIQIQTEKTKDRDDGIFKFMTDDYTLFEFFAGNRKYFDSTETVVELILDSLVRHTLIPLQTTIIAALSGPIYNTFQEIIDITIKELRNLDLPSSCQLIPNLIKSGTEIQKELDVISDWFYLNTTNSKSLLSIETVLDASVELTNKIHPNFQINPVIDLKCSPFGVYSNLIFVFNILFNNIIEHSKLPPENMKINVKIGMIENKYFEIIFTNSVNKDFDFSENVEKLEKVKGNWNDHTNIDKSNKEGESGFDKIKRILLYEAYSKTERFDFLLKNDKISIKLFFPYNKMSGYEEYSNN